MGREGDVMTFDDQLDGGRPDGGKSELAEGTEMGCWEKVLQEEDAWKGTW